MCFCLSVNPLAALTVGTTKGISGEIYCPFPSKQDPDNWDTHKSRGNDTKWGWENQQQTPVRNTCVCLATETVEDSWYGRHAPLVICTDSGCFLEDSLRSLAGTSAVCSLLYYNFPLSFLSSFKSISYFFFFLDPLPLLIFVAGREEYGDAHLACLWAQLS